MPGIKPHVDPQQLLSLLQDQFSRPILDLETVQGGEIAQTFSFTVDGQHCIMRFTTHMGANLEKEAYLYKRIASPQIPIPPIVSVDVWENSTMPSLTVSLGSQCIHCLHTNMNRCCPR